MPATINPVRKAILKKELLNPKNSVKDSLLKAGYSPITAHNSTNVKAVKICQAEIAVTLRAADITPDYVIELLAKELSATNAADRLTAIKMLGQFIAMFTDKREEIILHADERAELRPRLAEILARVQSEN